MENETTLSACLHLCRQHGVDAFVSDAGVLFAYEYATTTVEGEARDVSGWVNLGADVSEVRAWLGY